MRGRLLQENGRRGKRTPGGVNRIMSMVHTLLKDLEEAEIIPKAYKIKPLKENNARKEFFTREQIDQMVDVARTQRNDAELASAILFGVFTGCRQSELLGLRVCDVNLAENLVTFRDTKAGNDHTLDIHPEVREILEERIVHKNEEDQVFSFRNDDELRTAFYNVRDYCGISDKYVWHTLRHTTGTWLAARGVPIQTIAKILNHSQISTSERYTKVMDSARKEALNLL